MCKLPRDASRHLRPFWYTCWLNFGTTSSNPSLDLKFDLEGQVPGQRLLICKLFRGASYAPSSSTAYLKSLVSLKSPRYILVTSARLHMEAHVTSALPLPVCVAPCTFFYQPCQCKFACKVQTLPTYSLADDPKIYMWVDPCDTSGKQATSFQWVVKRLCETAAESWELKMNQLGKLRGGDQKIDRSKNRSKWAEQCPYMVTLAVPQ